MEFIISKWIEKNVSKDDGDEVEEMTVEEVFEEVEVFHLCCLILSVKHFIQDTYIVTVSDGTFCNYPVGSFGVSGKVTTSIMNPENYSLDIHGKIRMSPSDAKLKVGSFVKISNVHVRKFQNKHKLPFVVFKVQTFDSNVSALRSHNKKAKEIARKIQSLRDRCQNTLSLEDPSGPSHSAGLEKIDTHSLHLYGILSIKTEDLSISGSEIEESLKAVQLNSSGAVPKIKSSGCSNAATPTSQHELDFGEVRNRSGDADQVNPSGTPTSQNELDFGEVRSRSSDADQVNTSGTPTSQNELDFGEVRSRSGDADQVNPSGTPTSQNELDFGEVRSRSGDADQVNPTSQNELDFGEVRSDSGDADQVNTSGTPTPQHVLDCEEVRIGSIDADQANCSGSQEGEDCVEGKRGSRGASQFGVLETQHEEDSEQLRPGGRNTNLDISQTQFEEGQKELVPGSSDSSQHDIARIERKEVKKDSRPDSRNGDLLVISMTQRVEDHEDTGAGIDEVDFVRPRFCSSPTTSTLNEPPSVSWQKSGSTSASSVDDPGLVRSRLTQTVRKEMCSGKTEQFIIVDVRSLKGFGFDTSRKQLVHYPTSTFSDDEFYQEIDVGGRKTKVVTDPMVMKNCRESDKDVAKEGLTSKKQAATTCTAGNTNGFPLQQLAFAGNGNHLSPVESGRRQSVSTSTEDRLPGGCSRDSRQSGRYDDDCQVPEACCRVKECGEPMPKRLRFNNVISERKDNPKHRHTVGDKEFSTEVRRSVSTSTEDRLPEDCSLECRQSGRYDYVRQVPEACCRAKECGEPMPKRLRFNNVISEWKDNPKHRHTFVGVQPILKCGCIVSGSSLIKIHGQLIKVEPLLSASSLDLVCGVCPNCCTRTRYTMIKHLQPLRIEQLCHRCSQRTGEDIFLHLELFAKVVILGQNYRTYEATLAEEMKRKFHYCSVVEYISNPMTRDHIWGRFKTLGTCKGVSFLFYFRNVGRGKLELYNIKTLRALT